MKLALLLVVVYVVQSVLGYGSGISSTVFSVANYQAENGGFTTNIMELEQGNLEDTAHALFLASLYGVKDKVNAEQAQAFLQSVHNSNYGYANQPGQSSDLESLRNALLSYKYLESIPYDSSGVEKFVSGLYDSNSKLYRNSPGASPDYKATARALQVFDMLEVKGAEVSQVKEALLAKLTEAVKEKDGQSYFSSITSDNYFAILVADLVGFEFSDAAAWSKYFQARQVPSGPKAGGFFADEYATDADPSDAEYAVHALYILNGKQPVQRTLINLNSLNGFLNSLPPSLSNAGHSYAALARTVAFQDLFKLSSSFVVRGDQKFEVTGSRIVQGTAFSPLVFFRTTYGQSNAGATGSAVITHADKTQTVTFTYNTETQKYESTEFFDTTNLFGEVDLSFTFTFTTPGFEDLSFHFSTQKSIGYDISVSSKAVVDGKELTVGDEVELGTVFDFTVGLGTVEVAKPALVSGDFKLSLSVVDSSGVVVSTEEINGQGNSKALAFNYKLSEATFPAGALTFRFQVGNDAGVHTLEDVTYNLRVSMAAAEIDFDEEQILNLGQKISVSMQPGTIFDDAVHFYPKGNRRFFLDVFSSVNHLRLGSFPGQARSSGDSQEYVFEISIPSRFDFLGTCVVSFRYQDAAGNDVDLKNYDSEENVLFKDDLTFFVESGLDVAELTGAPESGDLAYGTEVSLSFKVQDSFSETFLQRGAGDSTVFLALRHTDKSGKAYTSAKVRAVPDRDETGQPVLFNVNWQVDPNAAKEPGQLILFALNADGTEIPIKSEGENWSVDVTVTGSFTIDHNSYSHEFDDADTSFLVSFEIESNGKRLAGSEFVARITGADRKVIGVVPATASSEGDYQVSWTLTTNQAKSGTYTVDIFKKGDVDRSSDALSGKSFFSVSLQHEGKAVSPLPFKTEFLALLGLGAALATISNRKVALEKKN